MIVLTKQITQKSHLHINTPRNTSTHVYTEMEIKGTHMCYTAVAHLCSVSVAALSSVKRRKKKVERSTFWDG